MVTVFESNPGPGISVGLQNEQIFILKVKSESKEN